MLLPYLSEVQNASKKYSVAFRGINYAEATQDGEFSDTHNISTDLYPCITPSALKLKEKQYTSPTDIHAKGRLLVVDGTKVIYDGSEKGEVTAGKKQIATIGRYIVIFPDKVYYDTENDEFGSMELTLQAGYVKFTSSTIVVAEAYGTVKFKEGDLITISGASAGENNKDVILRGIKKPFETSTTLVFDDNSFTAVDHDEGKNQKGITLKRIVPDLDFICESNYRLWGTHGNTIYGSKYSDPFNFSVFEGLSGDSYTIDVGSEGDFTGCIAYSSHICFFKEHTLHKLYGTKPSNFSLSDSNVFGVQSESERSMQIINETLLYKGVNGVYAYTGGVPELISGNFGNKRFSAAVACSDGEKYYISMRQGNEWGLYTFDMGRGIWLKEDDIRAVDMTFYDGKVYYIDSAGGLYFIDKSADRSDVEWDATFCTIHETINERKVYSKFHLRLDLSEGAYLAVDMKTDNDPIWKQIYATHNEKERTVSIPIMPTRCDSIDIRLRGKGQCIVKAFIREYRTGSDV